MKKFVNIDVLIQEELDKEEQNKVKGGTYYNPIIPPLTGYAPPEPPIHPDDFGI